MHSGSRVPWMLAAVLLATVLVAGPVAGQKNFAQKQAQVTQQTNRQQPQSTNTKKVSDSVTNLAQRIAGAIANQKSKTEIFSPVSIAGALSLLLLGSGGKTQTELLNVMGLNPQELSFRDIHLSFGRLFQDLVSNEPSLEPLVTWRLNDKCNRLDDEDDYEDEPNAEAPNKQNELPSHQISVANGVFLQSGLKPSNRYLRTTQQFYNGTIENLDFVGDPNGAATSINDWCSRATRGKIQEIVTPDVLLSSRMIVANALYFKAQWETTFSPFGTRQRPFYLNGQSEPSVKMDSMATSGCFPYYDASQEYNLQIIGLPYEKGRSTMYIIVPNESNRQKLQYTMSWLDASHINWMIDRMVMKKGMVVMPKLSISNRFHLRSLLAKLGLHDLFDPSRSNLSNVLDEQPSETSPQSESTRKPVVISRVDEQPTTRQPVRNPPQTQKPTTAPVRQGPQQQKRPQQAPQQNPQPQSQSSFLASKLTFPTDTNTCSLIENCEPVDNGQSCACSRTPSKQESTTCGFHVASISYAPANKLCPVQIREPLQQTTMNTWICIKPGYQLSQYTNPDTCARAYGCKMVQNRCYCCDRNLQSQSPQIQYSSALLSTPKEQHLSSSSVDEVYNSNIRLPGKNIVRYNGVICGTVESLNSRSSCTQYRSLYWDPSLGVCVDEETCGKIRKKRQQDLGSSQNPPWSQSSTRNLVPQPDIGTHQAQSIQFPQEQRLQNQYSQQQLTQQQQSQQQPQQPQQRVQPQQPNRQQEPLYVSEIITQVKLDVNEQGTEGGAVTAALIDRIGPNFSFSVDSPFLVLIRDDNTTLPLFYGAVYDPRP